MGWGGHGKQLRGRESRMEREKFCQECMKRTMEGGKEIMGKKKKKGGCLQFGEEEEKAERLSGYEEPLLRRRGTPGVEIPPTSLLNATSVLPGPACQQHCRYKGNHVCV